MEISTNVEEGKFVVIGELLCRGACSIDPSYDCAFPDCASVYKAFDTQQEAEQYMEEQGK